jgi:tryptophan synthase alpha chain
LANGIDTEECFNFAEKNIWWNTKILIMTYYNIVLNYWVENFVKKAKEIWIFWFIIPDVPFDENDWKKIRELCWKYNIVFTEIVSPITTKKRLEEIKNINPKLIYAISQNMTTGSKASFWRDFEKYIDNLKLIFSCQIWVWFWVKTREDVIQINNISDFAIIWSEFIKQFNNWGIKKLEKYLEELIK